MFLPLLSNCCLDKKEVLSQPSSGPAYGQPEPRQLMPTTIFHLRALLQDFTWLNPRIHKQQELHTWFSVLCEIVGTEIIS